MEKPSVLSLILLHGDNNKHTHLFVEFEEFDRANEEKHAKVEYHSSKNKTDTLYHVKHCPILNSALRVMYIHQFAFALT
ncbi:hypothetical protein K4S48_06995 [Staphylococcus epidermidis]|nr:hypothetical protein [Staphylococcus epidermidis]MCG2512337.1 hypothetical protein [Staphylococcus epidermidis]